MVGVRCVVCSQGGTSSDVNHKGVTYHRFPTNARQRQRWVESIMGHTIRDVTPERLKWMLQDDTIFGNWRVCSRHFEQSCFSESAMRKRLSSTARTLLNFDAVPTLFSEDEISEGPKYPELQKLLKPKEPEEHSGAPGVQLSSVKETAKRKRSEDTPDAAVESLTPVYLHSQLSRWKGACNNLELTDNQMAKFLLDRYYKGDKSVSAFSSSTHKTLLLDRELLTLWNDSKAAKGFSSDVDFLWFLLLGPQQSGTSMEGCTVRDHGASEECVPVKVDYVGPGYTASDTSQDSNDAANCLLILQPATCVPSPTQKNNITETAMTTQVPVTSQNNEMQMPRHKKSRKQVFEELSKGDPLFPESFGKEGSRCDHVDTAPTQQVGRTENHASTSYMATQRSSNTASRAKSRKQVNPQPGPREKPAKDMGNFENTTTCSKPTSGEVGIDLKEEEELETDPSDCDHSSTTCITSQLSFGTEGIRVKQKDDHNHSMSSQLSRDSAVSIKVEKEDGLEVSLSNFDNANASCPQHGANIKEEDKNTIDYENTNTPQLSHNTVSIKVEKEDGLEMDFGCCGNTNTSSHQSLEEELEMQLDSAIMATSKHLG